MSQLQLYHLCHPDTNEVKYIGITKNGLTRRLRCHLKNPTNSYMSVWIENLKKDNKLPIIKCVKECNTYDELLNSEIEEIKKFRSLGVPILNISDGGDINPMMGKTHSKEAREKISKTNKGRVFSDEEKKKRKEILKIFWNNSEWSEKVRKKMSNNTIGDKNPNWKGGVSNQKCECGNKKTYDLTCMSCRNMSGENNPFYGKCHSQETILKIKLAIENFGGFKGNKNPNFKYDISKDELYDLYIVKNKTIKEISLVYNCAINTINKKLRLYEIYKPKSNIYNLNETMIQEYLNQGLNFVEIGIKFGCSNKIIHKYVKKKKLYVK